MIILNILQGLSRGGGKKLLLEEGYQEEERIEKNDPSCDKLFLYPYCLYIRRKNVLKKTIPHVISYFFILTVYMMHTEKGLIVFIMPNFVTM